MNENCSEAEKMWYYTCKKARERATDMMTLGEKIKYYRSSMGITQAQFSSLSGIGLSTIKKLECDMMNPKPKMLLKIADALGVSINIFTDFDILTVSDVMSLITKMDEQVEMEFHADYDDEGKPKPETISISFKHPALNRQLADYVRTKDIQNKNDDDKEKYTNPAEQEAMKGIDDQIEMARLSICRGSIVIAKEHQDGHIRVKV